MSNVIKERRDRFLRNSGLTISALAKKIGADTSILSRNLRSRTTPLKQHAALVKLGVPVDCLPQAQNNRPY
jgi:ribosome-binding protein aMBF1 (putative translation factor)